MYVYVYIYLCICVCVYIHTHTDTHPVHTISLENSDEYNFTENTKITFKTKEGISHLFINLH